METRALPRWLPWPAAAARHRASSLDENAKSSNHARIKFRRRLDAIVCGLCRPLRRVAQKSLGGRGVATQPVSRVGHKNTAPRKWRSDNLAMPTIHSRCGCSQARSVKPRQRNAVAIDSIPHALPSAHAGLNRVTDYKAMPAAEYTLATCRFLCIAVMGEWQCASLAPRRSVKTASIAVTESPCVASSYCQQVTG